MRLPDDAELLTAYATQHSEEAFTELVGRHVALVYSAAVRQTGNPQLAEEVTQAVFIILARKARAVSRHTALSGWLCRVAFYVSRDALRAERRRQHREQLATPMENSKDTDWTQLSPLLDEAVAQLGEKDRSAIVLRFYEQKSLGEVGGILGVNADTAQKRVSRALEKLRKFVTKRGLILTAAGIAGAVTANSVQAAPAGLAVTISAAALAKGAAVGGSTLTLAKGALKLMAWTKAKTVVVAGVVVLLAAGTTTITIKEIQKHEVEKFPWESDKNLSSAWLEKAPPLLMIVPTKFPHGGGGVGLGAPNGNWKALYLGYKVDDLLEQAYGGRYGRTVLLTELPKEKYDFVMTLPSGSQQALRNEIRAQFGLEGRFAMIETNVLLLEVNQPNAAGLKPGSGDSGYSRNNLGSLSVKNQSISTLADMLESRFKMPVIDQSGLTNNFDIDLKWDETDFQHPNLENLKHAVLDQLGLELVPTNMPVEMLVVERVKN